MKASIGKCLCHGNLRDSQDIDIVGLKSYVDAQYSSEIGIGTPPPSLKRFTIILDTFGSNLKNGKFVDIHYGTGAISGFFSQDNVKVGALVVKN